MIKRPAISGTTLSHDNLIYVLLLLHDLLSWVTSSLPDSLQITTFQSTTSNFSCTLQIMQSWNLLTRLSRAHIPVQDGNFEKRNLGFQSSLPLKNQSQRRKLRQDGKTAENVGSWKEKGTSHQFKSKIPTQSTFSVNANNIYIVFFLQRDILF